MTAPTLDATELGRATLARQMLLARQDVSPADAVARLFALQAQLARPPFLGLWTRLTGFRCDQLIDLLDSRVLVRATMLRGTLHLVSADDYVRFRPVLQPMLEGALGIVGTRLTELSVEPTLRTARELLDERPRPFDELRDALVERGLPGDARAMGYAVRMLLPLVQVPTAARWAYEAKAPFAAAESWLGRPVAGGGSPAELVRRYLAAFGPASVADARAWSGLRGLRAAFEALRPELVSFRDPSGRELFDLPDAPRPGRDVPAPVRFLPEFDTLVLAHEDRSRVVAVEHRARIVTKNLQVAATVLVDGMVAGSWRTETRRRAAVLAVRPFRTLTRAERREVEEEGMSLLRFAEPDAREHAVRFD